MMKLKQARSLAACILAFLLAGCDVFTTETVLTGTIIDAHTKAPIEGIYVCLCGDVSFSYARPAALTTSDAEGRFRLATTHEQPNAFVVFANFGENKGGRYNPAYSGYTGRHQIGAREDRVIELIPTGQ